MKNFFKKYWALIFALLLIGLLAYGIIITNKYRNEKASNERLTSNSGVTSTPIQTTNRAGDSIAQNKVLRATLKELAETKKELKDRIDAYSKNGKKVVSYTEVITKTEDKISAPTTPPTDKEISFVTADNDTIKSLPFKFNDEFLTLSGEAFPKKVDIKYSITTKQEIVHRWDGGGLFQGDPNLVVEVNTLNPNQKVIGLTSVIIEPRAKRFYETKGFIFGVGFLIGAGGIIAITK